MTDSHQTKFYNIRNAFLTDLNAASAAVTADASLLNARSGLGETVLHWLAIENVTPAVQSLLAQGADADPKNDFGATPLMEAAMLGLDDMCQLLLAHGADVRYVNPRGESPLSHAARSRQAQTLRMLLSHFKPNESLEPYFDEVELSVVFGTNDEVTSLLRSRGLSPKMWESP